MSEGMNLTDYKVKEIRYPHGAYCIGEEAELIDEGSSYQIDGAHMVSG